jgi:3-oxoadipate enol-lactonase
MPTRGIYAVPHLVRGSLHDSASELFDLLFAWGAISLRYQRYDKVTYPFGCCQHDLENHTMATDAPVSAYYTTTSGTQLHYLQTGSSSGPLLLCLHGLGGSSGTFTPLLPYLPPTHNIVLVDFPGFGKAPPPQAPKIVSVAGHVADVGELIATLRGTSTASHAENVVIIGHSLGAIVALQYAAQSPVSIGGLVLLGAGRAAGHIPAVRQRMRDLAAAVRVKGIAFAADIAAKSNFYDDTYVSMLRIRVTINADRPCRQERIADPSARQAVKDAVLASDPEAYAQTCEAIVDLEHKDPEYEDILAPAVFVVGDRDMISPVERSHELSRRLGGTSWVEIVRGGHQPILEDIIAVKHAVDKLLGSVAVCLAARALRDP